MSDLNTIRLAKMGKTAYKYLAFGPTEKLYPYLLRRAEETSYLGAEMKKQLNEIIKELFIYRKHLLKLPLALLLLYLIV